MPYTTWKKRKLFIIGQYQQCIEMKALLVCGVSDAQKSIEEKIYGGKCTDISSVFVCLLRNAKIPARRLLELE